MLELYSYVQVTFIAHIPGNVKGMVRNRYIRHGSRDSYMGRCRKCKQLRFIREEGKKRVLEKSREHLNLPRETGEILLE